MEVVGIFIIYLHLIHIFCGRQDWNGQMVGARIFFKENSLEHGGHLMPNSKSWPVVTSEHWATIAGWVHTNLRSRSCGKKLAGMAFILNCGPAIAENRAVMAIFLLCSLAIAEIFCGWNLSKKIPAGIYFYGKIFLQEYSGWLELLPGFAALELGR